MCDNSGLYAQMSIDFKKHRMRIHKESLRLIGEPKYIQLLVNVGQALFAIRGIDNESRGLSSHRVDRAKIDSDFSFEIYSRSFVAKLGTVFGCFDRNCTYRLTGTVLPNERAILFSVNSLQKIESGEG